MRRAWLLLVLVAALSVSVAEAQRGRGFGRFGGEAGVPPRFPTDADQDGGFHFCRLMYRTVRAQPRGMGWGTDYPFADINFSQRLSEMTRATVSRADAGPSHLVVRPTDEWLSLCPFVMASDPGTAGFTDEDAAALRAYLLKGGFLWADDYWGPYAWDDFARELAKVLPPGQYPIRDLAADHPLFRALFQVPEIPQVPAWQFWRQTGGDTSELGRLSQQAHAAAISDAQGRIMVLLTHNTDIADSWEREGEDAEYFRLFSPKGYALGMNVAVYAMSH
jgi:hypothetical protein